MTSKRKPGRPPIPPEQRRRGRQAVAVKFSAVEYAEVRAGAIAASMSVPDYLLAGRPSPAATSRAACALEPPDSR